MFFPGFGGGGIPRFTKDFSFDPMLLVWALALIPIGILTGALSDGINKVFVKIRTLFKENRLLPLLIAAISLAVIGFFFPDAMFSGEHQLGPIINDYQSYGLQNLIIVGLLKLILVYMCINFG